MLTTQVHIHVDCPCNSVLDIALLLILLMCFEGVLLAELYGVHTIFLWCGQKFLVCLVDVEWVFWLWVWLSMSCSLKVVWVFQAPVMTQICWYWWAFEVFLLEHSIPVQQESVCVCVCTCISSVLTFWVSLCVCDVSEELFFCCISDTYTCVVHI